MKKMGHIANAIVECTVPITGFRLVTGELSELEHESLLSRRWVMGGYWIYVDRVKRHRYRLIIEAFKEAFVYSGEEH